MPVPLHVTPCKPVFTNQQDHLSSISDKFSALQLANVVTPSPVSLTRSDSSSSSEDFELTIKKIVKTAHKLREESGEFAEEPLLKANPHRFVLFPIQDNEVCTITHRRLPAGVFVCSRLT